MKVQIDENNYLTGSYCLVGDLDGSIEMDKLPDSDSIYYPAYKIVSEQIEKKIIVYEEVKKTRELKFPILDEDGKETGEFNVTTEEYTDVEPVEKIVYETLYHYELDEVKKNKIDYDLNNPIIDNTPDLKEVAKQIHIMQNIIDVLLFQ